MVSVCRVPRMALVTHMPSNHFRLQMKVKVEKKAEEGSCPKSCREPRARDLTLRF